ncbi:MAG: hypothetical protein R3C08_09715 [Hyphomonas sp.]
MSFLKEGKFFPRENGSKDEITSEEFAAEIAAALQRSLGSGRARIKIVAGWTGANERTVKNWFSGLYGPSGEHLVGLVRHSDEVLEAFLSMAERQNLLVTTKLVTIEHAILELLTDIRRLAGRE